MIINGINFRITNRGRQCFIENMSYTDKVTNDTIIKQCIRSPYAWWVRARTSSLYLLVYHRFGKEKKVPDYTSGWPETSAEDLLSNGTLTVTRYKIFCNLIHKYLKIEGALPNGEIVKGFLAHVTN